MKKALINPIDKIENKSVVVSVSDTEFETTPAYFWVNCPDNIEAYWLYDNNEFFPPYVPPAPTPTPEEYIEFYKSQAILKLKNSDWVEFPSVSDTSSTPHLLNLNEFIVYRNALRAIAVSPPNHEVSLPVKPIEKWSSV